MVIFEAQENTTDEKINKKWWALKNGKKFQRKRTYGGDWNDLNVTLFLLSLSLTP